MSSFTARQGITRRASCLLPRIGSTRELRPTTLVTKQLLDDKCSDPDRAQTRGPTRGVITRAHGFARVDEVVMEAQQFMRRYCSQPAAMAAYGGLFAAVRNGKARIDFEMQPDQALPAEALHPTLARGGCQGALPAPVTNQLYRVACRASASAAERSTQYRQTTSRIRCPTWSRSRRPPPSLRPARWGSSPTLT